MPEEGDAEPCLPGEGLGEALMFQAVGGDGRLVLPFLYQAEGSRARGGVAESPVSTERNRWSQEVSWVPVRFPNSCASGRVSK